MSFILYLFLNIIISFVLTVAVHETGHLIGGLCSGYVFTSIELFGIRIVKDFEGLKIRHPFKRCLGQCLMHPKVLCTDPVRLILGGCIANIVVFIISSMFLIAAYAGIFGNLFLHGIIASICMVVMNLTAAITNLACISETNDGSTYKDASMSSAQTEIYNRLMSIYCLLAAGEEIENLDEEMFASKDILYSSLSAELAGLRYLHVYFKYRFDETKQNEIKNERNRLEAFAPNILDMEAIDGIRFIGKVF